MSKTEKIFLNKYFVTSLWFGLSLFAVIKQTLSTHINNYRIYKYVFINLINQVNLYSQQPAHFEDSNHYGPLFGLLIAPFTCLPDSFGCILWVMFNALVLYIAIRQLPITNYQKFAVLLISAHELMTASYNVQFNPIMAAIIILSFVFINRKQDFWATLLIVAGTFIKLYGIVGLAFFFFSKDKFTFIWSFVLWSVLLFCLPMVISSPHFVLQSYYDWYNSLSHKNVENIFSAMQDISVMGMIRRVFNYGNLSNMLVLLPGLALFCTAYMRYKSFESLQFRLLLLASTLIFTVIFSTGSESPTYVIAFAGVAVWFMNLDRPVTGFEIFLLIFALLITSLSPSDLFPQVINRSYIKPFAFKALPCFIIWLKIIYETLTRRFSVEPQQTVLA